MERGSPGGTRWRDWPWLSGYWWIPANVNNRHCGPSEARRRGDARYWPGSMTEASSLVSGGDELGHGKSLSPGPFI